MHPITFLDFDRSKLTPREAQFLEALLWIAGEMPRQMALQLGQSPEQAARAGACVAFNMLGATFPDLNLHLIEPRPIAPLDDPPPPSSPRPITDLSSVSREPSKL